MPTAADFLATLRSYLGKTEQPPGSNNVPGVTDVYGFRGAWCLMLLMVVAARAKLATPVRTAWVPAIVDAARQGLDGWTWIAGTDGGQPGDWVIYNYPGGVQFDHIECVETVAGTSYTTIGGNVGDACKRLARPARGSYIAGFVRPVYAPPVTHSDGYPLYPGGVFAEGTKAPFVTSIQHVTRAAGCGPTDAQGGEDGDFGPATKAAVECWQTKLGLPEHQRDGEWGPVTQQKTDAFFAFVAGK